MGASDLYVFTARFNPLRWRTPERTYQEWVSHVLASGARLVVVEVQYGERPFTCQVDGSTHIGLRADSWAWSKEAALNEAIRRIPEARYIAWGDADVWHHRPDWAAEAVEALQHYRVIQTWSQALDLGPQHDLLAVHHAFCALYQRGAPVVANGSRPWKSSGGYHEYPHTGYFWAARRDFFDATGGLIEVAGMGSADHHMALGLVGAIERSWPAGTSDAYQRHLGRWQARAQAFVNGRIGAVEGLIEHRFHGSKAKRGYIDRWAMFVAHGFDPDTDLIRNSHGVIEWAGNKPAMELAWDQYLRSRREDDNFV